MSKLINLSDTRRSRNLAADARPHEPWEAAQPSDDAIIGQAVVSIDLADDGSRFGIAFMRDGLRYSLILPIECLNGLIMTLPSVMKRALQLRHRDETLRLVYPVSAAQIERSSDPKLAIATFATPDGFEVSFSLTHEQITIFRDAADAVELSQGNIQAGIVN